MRRLVGKVVHAKAGDDVVVACRLLKTTDARLSVWSACDGYDMAPHIQMASLLVVDGAPKMVQPMYFRLTEHHPHHEITFTADEDLTFCIQQDVDTPTEQLARAKIKVYHGSFSKRARRFFQDFWRFCCSGAKDGIGHYS